MFRRVLFRSGGVIGNEIDLARAAAEKALVLRGDQHRRTEDRRPREHDAVVALRLDVPSREVRRRPRRGQRIVDAGSGARIGNRRDAIGGRERAQRERRVTGGQGNRRWEIADMTRSR